MGIRVRIVFSTHYLSCKATEGDDNDTEKNRDPVSQQVWYAYDEEPALYKGQMRSV